MSDEKVPRFLQQTTSQLLHQQEALRKRREMLERESNRPPAMRFGTSSPPRSHSRHGRSPVPPTLSTPSTPPRADNVQRELNWSRTEDDHPTVPERAPMRFSMTFRPGPTAAAPALLGTPVHAAAAGPAPGKSRAPTALPTPPQLPLSPTPREVNTADRPNSVSRKAVVRDAVATPRTVSPRSPASQRARVEQPQQAVAAAAENVRGRRGSPAVVRSASRPPADVPVQIFTPQPKAASTTEVLQTETHAMDEAEEDAREMTRAEKRQSLPPPPPFPGRMTAVGEEEEKETEALEADPSGITGFSNTFAVPRFTPTTPLEHGRQGMKLSAEGSAASGEESESTPGRPAVGEFRTPRPVTRMSTSLTPVVRDSPTQPTTTASSLSRNEEAQRETSAYVAPHNETASTSQDGDHAVGIDEERTPSSALVDGVRDGASPVPTPSQVLASLEASTEKRRGVPVTPAMSRDHDAEKGEQSSHPSHGSRSPSHTLNTSASRSMELRTPSPTRRTKASPAPTAQDLISSVQASGDRRPCGCERPTPSPESWSRHRSTHTPATNTTNASTASPAPTPVPPFDAPMTEFTSLHHKCCDRPTPLSLSSQPAGGEARVTSTASASPWPTTDHIVSSILAGTQEAQRRAREDGSGGDANTSDAEEGSSNEEAQATAMTSPNAMAPPPPFPSSNEEADTTASDSVSAGAGAAAAMLIATTHTPSPVPTERQYGESVFASAEKRRCGRPTPDDRLTSAGTEKEGDGGRLALQTETTSASPQPTAHHLLDSLDVSIHKGCNSREKPAERVHAEGEVQDGNERHQEEEEEEGATQRTGEKENSEPSANASSEHDAASLGPRRALRTPSPTPTPDHILASLQASAEKRTRSAALAMSNASGDVSRSANGSPTSNSFQSPTLTPQNVKDSVQKLMSDKQQQTRSDAQVPQRPWEEEEEGAEETEEERDKQKFACENEDAVHAASASPVVTAEDVDMSLAAVEQDQRRRSRSARQARETERPSSTTDAETDDIISPQTAADSTHEESQVKEKPSPTPSDFVTQSAMFFDCVSAPITPSLPTVETVAVVQQVRETIATTTVTATTATTNASAAAVSGAADSYLPPQFYELQREIAVLKASRSRTRTPPPLHASEASSPVPRDAERYGVEEFNRTSHKKTFAEKELMPMDQNTTAQDDRDEEEEAVAARRSSLLLVQPTPTHHAIIQHPHEPVPEMPPPSISPVRVPRTPTPPPASRHPATAQRDERQFEESPLPRPVSLRSQVMLFKSQHQNPLQQRVSQPKVQYARSPPPTGPAPLVASERSARSFHENHAPLAVHGMQRVHTTRPSPTAGPHRPRSVSLADDAAAAAAAKEEEDEVDIYDAENDWMDPVAPLRLQTLTVSPRGGAVVYTTHDSEDATEEAESDEEKNEAERSPVQMANTRKRSRSARTPPARTTLADTNSVSAARQAATPASVALTLDDTISSGGKSPDLLMHTPSSHASQTPRSSPRGRRSQAEALLAMLPDDVVAEVARMTETEMETADSEVDVLNTRTSTGSLQGRVSGLSEEGDDESTTAQMSTISQRVSQRGPRVRRSESVYNLYLEGMARSSAKKTRAAAGRRMQKVIKKDVAKGRSGNGGELADTGSPDKSPHTSTTTKAGHKETSSSFNETYESSPLSSKDVMLSPASFTPVPGERSQLKVSTRLSTELQQALFRDSPAPSKKTQQLRQSSGTATSTKSKKKKAKKAKKAKTLAAKRGSPAKTLANVPAPPPASVVEKAEQLPKKATTAHVQHHKKAAARFVTAKSLRSIKRSSRDKKKH